MRTLYIVVACGLLTYSAGVVSGFRAWDYANTAHAGKVTERDRQQLNKFVKKIEQRRKRCVKLHRQGHQVPYCQETWGLK